MSEAGSQYQFSKRGRVYCACIEPGTTASAVGHTSFLDTRPTILLYKNPLGSAVPREIVGFNLRMEQQGTLAGGEIHIVVQVDGASRYNSSGTEVSAVPMNYDFLSDSASGTVYYAATASGCIVSTKTAPITIEHAVVEQNIGDVFSVDYDDTVILEAGYARSLLIYTRSATTPPSWNFRLEWIEKGP